MGQSNHIRTTDVIESVFATVRLRTYKTKGIGPLRTTLAMAFELVQETQKAWRMIANWQELKQLSIRPFKGEILVKDTAA